MRTLPAIAIRIRRAKSLSVDADGLMKMSQVLPGAFGPFDLVEADPQAPVPADLSIYGQDMEQEND